MMVELVGLNIEKTSYYSLSNYKRHKQISTLENLTKMAIVLGKFHGLMICFI
jgi:hypothetical protein